MCTTSCSSRAVVAPFCLLCLREEELPRKIHFGVLFVVLEDFELLDWPWVGGNFSSKIVGFSGCEWIFVDG